MKKKKIYRVKTQYIFKGIFEVLTESKENARRKVLQDCELVMGGSIHSTLLDEEINFSSNALNNLWAFSSHPRSKDRANDHSKGVNNSVLDGRHIRRPLLSFMSRAKGEKERSKETKMKNCVTLL